MSKEKEEKVLLEKCECGNMVHDDAPACLQCGKVKDKSFYERISFWFNWYIFTVPLINYFVLTGVFDVKEDLAENISILLFVLGIIFGLFITHDYNKKFKKHPYARRNYW
ncbi:MAG: hypothetical protein RBS91_03080 [Sulfurimonadaceae bacterium]|jgi:hypothetical protein|nr:hypothetical protein [Sulfurimonadaceae bacterium]